MLKEMFDAVMIMVKVGEHNREEFEMIRKATAKIMLDNEEEFRKLVVKADYYLEQNKHLYMPSTYTKTTID